ncbi:MAG: tRNA (5-methylaminomethyl-2-thiouridine)(34)-methyltransferase MnmD [Bacteroidales bacterium]|nr:tRNA (5-methylaminomethyl-2-thiouridine)(34)-methyltransferase MnmD [Bacteroidales bacterium]
MLVVPSKDGSKTIYSERFGEHYHSVFGAVGESMHVFVRGGYLSSVACPVSVLEIGFGAGWNACLTMQQAQQMNRPTYYESIELYPVDMQTAGRLNADAPFLRLHAAEWEKPVSLHPCFVLHKRRVDLTEAVFTQSFDVIYFDAFSPEKQPEMWTTGIFAKLFAATRPQGIFVTYCAKGAVRRSLQATGYTMERLPGPEGKREMLRGRKIIGMPG